MRLRTRTDLGGYAAAGSTLDVEIRKPFVLLCGPNGSGKTATLRMLRAAVGLHGERAGYVGTGFGKGGAKVRDGDDDLGRLAAATVDFHGREAVASDRPGTLDVRALGWRGQRTWLFDSRSETLRLDPAEMDSSDLATHSMEVTEGRNASHGQALRRSWMQALWFAAGLQEHADPYDAGDPPPHLRAIRDALFPDGRRPEERWLLVDEPETAVDASTLMTGLSLMLEEAREGSLRVFCASHSPVFVAGLADHPKVQVVETGPTQWFSRQREILESLRDKAGLASEGARIGRVIREDHRRMREAAAARKEGERASVIESLTAGDRRLLVAIREAGGTLGTYRGKPVERIMEHSINGMARRPALVRYREGCLSLTDYGADVARSAAGPDAAPDCDVPPGP